MFPSANIFLSIFHNFPAFLFGSIENYLVNFTKTASGRFAKCSDALIFGIYFTDLTVAAHLDYSNAKRSFDLSLLPLHHCAFHHAPANTDGCRLAKQDFFHLHKILVYGKKLY